MSRPERLAKDTCLDVSDLMVKQNRALDPDKPFQPILIFLSEARAYLSRVNIQVDFRLAQKY